jgi:hypothetical protein
MEIGVCGMFFEKLGIVKRLFEKSKQSIGIRKVGTVDLCQAPTGNVAK